MLLGVVELPENQLDQRSAHASFNITHCNVEQTIVTIADATRGGASWVSRLHLPSRWSTFGSIRDQRSLVDIPDPKNTQEYQDGVKVEPSPHVGGATMVEEESDCLRAPSGSTATIKIM